jgi:hypothetical protein
MKNLSFYLLSLILISACKENETITVKEMVEAPKNIAAAEALKNPVVLKVSSDLENGQYNSGDILAIYAQFDKIVEVEGTPILKLNFNGSTKNAQYSSGSGTNRLVFNYTLTKSDKTSKLSYTDSDALELGTAQIKDVRGAQAEIGLPNPGETNSLDANKTIKSGLSDNFNNSNISTQWTKLDQDNYDADGNSVVNDDFNLALIEQNGLLTISTRGADLYGTTRQMNGIYLDNQTGNFDYSLKIVNMNNTNTLARAGFFLSTDITQSNGGVYFCGTSGASNVLVSYSTTNNNNLNVNLQNGTSQKPVWLRIKKTNNNLSCYYKYNELDAWTLHSSGTRTITDSTSLFDLGIVATAKSTTSTLQVQIDDFIDLL